MTKILNIKHYLLIMLGLLILPVTQPVYAQYDYKWMSVGSMQSYYTASGSEIEEGRVKEQQDGLQWPALYRNQDMSAAKGLWIGCTNFKDASGAYSYRVVHVGPRVSGGGEFFPLEIKLLSKTDPTAVFVDDNPSMGKTVEVDKVGDSYSYTTKSLYTFQDTTITVPVLGDRMIFNRVNTLIGLTMERKIYAFSHPYHDNYIVSEYTFTNTGNTNADDAIERPDSTLRGVYIYLNWRLAVNKEIRYVVGNGSGWGMNTMYDTHWIGNTEDQPANENFRTTFAWHGYWPAKQVTYNNIGASIWTPDATGLVAKNDTIGRLGAPQFMGILTVYAQKSVDDASDDPTQPVVATYEGSDDPSYSGNDAFNQGKMTGEYEMMSKYDKPNDMKGRHAYVVYPGAKGKPFSEFANQKASPDLATSGGFSAVNGYGPYTIPYGKSIKIIVVEGAAGLDRDACIRIGRKYKQALTDSDPSNDAAVELEKDQAVLTGKDSLMQTWRRVIANYNSNWQLVNPPKAPTVFNVKSGGDKIMLSWTPAEDPTVKGFEVYRAIGQYDSTYYLVHSAGASETSWDDKDLVRGQAYYYYIVSVGDQQPAVPELNIPVYTAKSSRYYTQAFDPAYLKRQAGKNIEDVRIVPNPYIISKDNVTLGYGNDYGDKIMFYNIPGYCTIKIYTELGELINTIDHSDGSGDQSWVNVTSSKQIIVSGIYIAVVTDKVTGKKSITKFAVIR